MAAHDSLRVIYSIHFDEVQKVANENFGRELTESELERLIRRCKEKFSSQIPRLIKKSIKEERYARKTKKYRSSIVEEMGRFSNEDFYKGD